MREQYSECKKDVPTSTAQVRDILKATKEGGIREQRDSPMISRDADLSGRGSNHIRRVLRSMMNGKNQVVQKFRETGHERVLELPEVCAIAHFLSEEVGRNELPGHMLDVESVVLDPLTN